MGKHSQPVPPPNVATDRPHGAVVSDKPTESESDETEDAPSKHPRKKG